MVVALSFTLGSGCETTSGPSNTRVRLPIAAPEWEIEEQILGYTPVGAPDDAVLEFVNHRLIHSEKEASEYDNIAVYVNDGSDSPFPEQLNYKIIQVHMGLHGSANQDFILRSNWVYITWLFEHDHLIDIVVTKVVPGGDPEPNQRDFESIYEEVFHPEASNRF